MRLVDLPGTNQGEELNEQGGDNEISAKALLRIKHDTACRSETLNISSGDGDLEFAQMNREIPVTELDKSAQVGTVDGGELGGIAITCGGGGGIDGEAAFVVYGKLDRKWRSGK
ncbi:hypothetical protein L2E82_35223 [Cichorium intybus]|uniref:Uncharacterized protein n=1 Tax=Cichorium intybus TaxID=13427 RepID=A0ACB9BNG6_CICIN|nr:hypothetical protein L2E82_35223 [Cichorium intybus]